MSPLKMFAGLAMLLFWSGRIAAALPQESDPRLEITSEGNRGAIRLRFPFESGLILEQTEAIPDGVWTRLSVDVEPGATVAEVVLNSSSVARFFRLRSVEVTTVESTSPMPGETGVAVTRESILRFSSPLAEGAVLDGTHLYASFGGRQLLARVEVSSDRRKASLFYLEPLPGSARVSVVLDAAGLRDERGELLDPAGTGQPGGRFEFQFETLSLSTLVNTAVEGTVLAAEILTGAGGVRSDLPLEGVTITVDGAEDTLRTTTDARGRFRLEPVPPGRFFVHIDGRTAKGSSYPSGAYYPSVGKAWEAVAGVGTNLAGGTGVIYLPRIAGDTLQPVSLTKPTTITLPASVVSANPALARVSVTVPANALFADNGTRGGKVGLAPVPPDRLPGPLPDGLQFPLVLTVQTDGALNFDRPASICFPNLPDPVLGTPLPAGSEQALVSFDHKKGEWVVSGSMTVSADGSMVCTDPGSGIQQPGWHGVAPPPYRPPPPPPPDRCEAEDSGAELSGLELQEAAKRNRKSCNCKPDPKSLELLNRNCTKLLEACIDRVSAKGSRELRRCQNCDPFEFPRPCTTEEGKKFQDLCFKKAHLGAVRERAQCYNENLECVESAYKCYGPIGSLAGLRALHGTTVTLKDQVIALLAAADDLIAPYAESDADMPDAVVETIRQFMAQADTLAGGDAAAFLETSYAQIAAEFGDSPATFDLGNAPEYPVQYVATVKRGSTRVTLRGKTEAFGQYAIFVPRDGTLVDVRFYDVRTGRYASVLPILASGRVATGIISNSVYQLPRFTLLDRAASDRDADGDGLSDDAELVLGTDAANRDSDADGIPDGAEVEQGTNPLDGRVAQTGVIATARTPGAALDVWTGNGWVVTAEGAAGISLFRPFNGSNPTIVSHVATPGVASRVAGTRGYVVVAGGNAGVSIVSVPESGAATLARQVNLPGALAVVADLGAAFVGLSSGEIVAVDLENGRVHARATLGGAIQDLARSGDFLFALTGDRLSVLTFTGDALSVVGSVASPFTAGANQRLFVGSGVAYTVYRKGFNTFDISTPTAPALLGKGETTLFGWRGLVSNGSGLGVAAVGPNSTDDGPHDVSLYDLRASATSNVLVTTLPTPGIARAVSILNGLAYVADDRSGLQVVSYLPYDSKGVSPTVRFPAGFGAAGVEEGSRVSVTALAADDVQVRHVELHVDGVQTDVDGSYPFEFRFVSPPITPARSVIKLRARAVDTGGNATWSDELVIALKRDGTAPRVLETSPVGGGRSIASVSARFSEDLDPKTVVNGSLRVMSAGPDAQWGTADDAVIGGGTVRYVPETRSILWTSGAPLPSGRYRATVGTTVADVAGNRVAEPFTWEFQVADAVFWARAGGGDWGDPLNWSGAAVPGADDAVVVDLPAIDVTVTRTNGPVTARTLFSTERILVSGGSIEVPGGIEMRSTLTLVGTRLRNSTISVAGDGRLSFLSFNTSTLEAVTINGDVDLSRNDARVLVRSGLTLNGSILIGGASAVGFAGVQTLDRGTIVFTGDSGNLSVEGNSTLTLGPDVVVRGKSGTIGQPVFQGGASKLINRGLISVDVAGGTLSIRAAEFENAGRMETRNGGNLAIRSASWSNTRTIVATGGSLTLDGTFSNTGSVESEAATVNIEGDFTLARLGTFRRTGGLIRIRSVLDLGGGNLTLNAGTGPWQFDGGRLTGGTLIQEGAGQAIFSTSPANTFDGVTVTGDLNLTTGGARLLVRNGLTMTGRVLLDNQGAIGFAGVQRFDSGTIVFTGDGGLLSVEGNSTLTLGPLVVVRGKSGLLGQPVFSGGVSRLVNEGKILADVAGGTLSIRAGLFENSGTLETQNGGNLAILSSSWANTGSITALGGVLTLDGRFTNTGVVRSDGAAVNIDGDFTLAGLGTLKRAGGVVRLRSVLDLRGGRLDLNADTGPWILDGGRILGGTVTQTDSGKLVFSANPVSSLDAVTLAGDLDLTTGGARLLVRNGLTMTGRVLLNNQGAIGFAGVQRFDSGSIVFTGDSGLLSVEGNSTLTLGPLVVVRGKTGTLAQPVFSGGSSTLINQGLITADVAGGSLSIRGARFENPGRVEARNGGSVAILSTTWRNDGAVSAVSGALSLDGSFENAGTVRTDQAAVNLDGDLTLARLGDFQRTSGTVRLRSTLDLRGATLGLDDTTGPWIIDGGRVLGGTVRQTGAGKLVFSASPANTFDGVTAIGDLDLSTGGARLLVRNGLTLSGSVKIDRTGAIGFAGVQTFNTGKVEFLGDSGSLSVEGNSTLTLGPDMVVRGKTGLIGQPVFSGGPSTLINQGLISADVAGGTLTIRPGTFQNTGRLEEKNGGRIVRP